MLLAWGSGCRCRGGGRGWWPTLSLEPLEQGLCRQGQASEAEAVAQVDDDQPQGVVLGRLAEVLPKLLQPQPDHWQQRAGGGNGHVISNAPLLFLCGGGGVH